MIKSIEKSDILERTPVGSPIEKNKKVIAKKSVNRRFKYSKLRSFCSSKAKIEEEDSPIPKSAVGVHNLEKETHQADNLPKVNSSPLVASSLIEDETKTSETVPHPIVDDSIGDKQEPEKNKAELESSERITVDVDDDQQGDDIDFCIEPGFSTYLLGHQILSPPVVVSQPDDEEVCEIDDVFQNDECYAQSEQQQESAKQTNIVVEEQTENKQSKVDNKANAVDEVISATYIQVSLLILTVKESHFYQKEEVTYLILRVFLLNIIFVKLFLE